MKIFNIVFNFDIDYPDLETGVIYQKKSIQLLSFNSISPLSGKCDKCDGHGFIVDIDFKDLILKEKKLSEYFLNLEDNKKGCYKYIGLCQDTLARLFKKHQININMTYYDLISSQQQIIKDEIYPKILKHQTKPSIGKFVLNFMELA